jgi:Domain of unknown function (DUF397)
MQVFRNGMSAGSIEGSWVKASASNANGQCVEIAALGGGQVAVRNSTDPSGPALIFTPQEFSAFLDGARHGEFDGLAGS